MRASAETKALMSAVRKGRKHTAAHAEAISRSLRGRALGDPVKRRESMKTAHLKVSPERKAAAMEKRLAARSKWWSALSRDQRTTVIERAYRASSVADSTSIERAVQAVLRGLGIAFEANARIGFYIVDVYIPSKNLVIECDGDYWHNLPGRKERDAERDAWLMEVGFNVLRLSEKAIKAGEHVEVLKRLA